MNPRRTATYRELTRQRWALRREALSFAGQDSEAARLGRANRWRRYFSLGYQQDDLRASFARTARREAVTA